jgi:flagellar export protein FliJ
MAKKFNFRLESVLNLKSSRVQKAKDDLNQILNLKYNKEKQIEEMQVYFQELLTMKKGHCSIDEFQANYHHKNYIKGELANLEKQKRELVEIENLRRIALVEAMKEENILIKLKEKKKIIYNQELEKEDTKTLDEIAQNKFIYNKENFILT